MVAEYSAREARQELYGVMRSDKSFEEKSRDALTLGKSYLGVDNGHLTRIDPDADHWEAVVSTDSPEGQFPPGLELDLGTTYCRRTLTADGQITLHDASTQGWDDDVAFETHALDCYLGTTLVVNDEPFGTVCFVSTDARSEPFSDEEAMFAELITRMLERELERDQQNTALIRQTNLATVLNRVLRHNLRNDLAVIRGYTRLMTDTLETDSYGEIALTHIDKLLSLSQKARELDRIIADDPHPDQIEIVQVVEGILEDIEDGYPSATIDLQYDERITLTLLPSFTEALEEVLENAAKHSGDCPTIHVTIGAVPNAVEIRVEDDGPGLADHEAAVLETGTETPLSHGTGLGLWLAYWVVTTHGGSIDASVTDMGTTMTISVPTTPVSGAQKQVATLQRTRDQYQAAFEEANDAMVIFNDDAKIVDANVEASNLYEVDRSNLLGRELTEFLPDEFDFAAAWDEFQDSGEIRDTVTIMGADGETRLVDYTARADIVPGLHFTVVREIKES